MYQYETFDHEINSEDEVDTKYIIGLGKESMGEHNFL